MNNSRNNCDESIETIFTFEIIKKSSDLLIVANLFIYSFFYKKRNRKIFYPPAFEIKEIILISRIRIEKLFDLLFFEQEEKKEIRIRRNDSNICLIFNSIYDFLIILSKLVQQDIVNKSSLLLL